jgi:hypothetical protein
MTTQLNQIAAQHHIAELHRQAAVVRMTRPAVEPRTETRRRTRLVRFTARLAAARS